MNYPTFEEIRNAEDPKGVNHDLTLTCAECGRRQTCRCSKPKRQFTGICSKCFDKTAMHKQAYHAQDRGKERLNLSPESVDSIQKAVDRMWFSGGHKKLTGDFYHTSIRNPHHQVLGYAALKRVNSGGKRPRLILSTIMGPNSKPRGSNISHFFDHVVHDNKVDLHLLPKFKELPPVPDNKSS